MVVVVVVVVVVLVRGFVELVVPWLHRFLFHLFHQEDLVVVVEGTV